MARFLLAGMIALMAAQVLGLLIWKRRLSGRPRASIILFSAFVIANLPWIYFFKNFGADQLPPGWVTSFVIRPFVTWQSGTILWLLVGSILTIALLLAYRLPKSIFSLIKKKKTDNNPLPDKDRRNFLIGTARTAVWTGVFVSTGYGLARASCPPLVKEIDLTVPGLPKELEGLRIAHLSDLHVGLWTSIDEIADSLALTRDLKPDLVVMTGDLIDHKPEYSLELVKLTPLLDNVPLGVFGVIGNHDVYTGADKVTASLEQGGIRMLRNRFERLKGEGLPLSLIGVDDPGRRWTGSGGSLPLDKASQGMPEGDFPILLAHRPTAFDQARKDKLPLTLCGHTHGGQFALPGGPNLADAAYEYTKGVYRKEDCLVHVSPGIGSVGLPFRLGVPAEITILRLKS